MLEFLFDAIVTLLAIRAIWKLLQNLTRTPRRTADSRQARQPGPPEQGVHMEKDPVCGTYVVPDRALSMSVGRQTIYFCSAACRDKYRPSTGSGRPESPEGRAKTA